jgi:hypothetical protein
MNRRRGLVAALIVVAGLAVVLALALRSPGAGVPRPLTASTHARGLSLSIPRGFHDYPLHGDPTTPGVFGRVLTDFRLPAEHPRGWRSTIEWELARWDGAQWRFMAVKHHDYGPPSNGVALELEQTYGPGCIGPCPPPPVRLHLPLDPQQPWFQETLASGAPSYRWGYLRFRHELYYVMYWIGPDAPANDRDAVLRALGSIRPTT